MVSVARRLRRPLSAIVVACAVASLGACGGGPKQITVSAIFKQIGDLPRFANVQSSDVVIGSVRGISLDGYHARVQLRINANADIPRNAIALIRSTSLLGEEFVDLRAPVTEPPSPDVLHNGDVIPLARTTRIPGLDDALIGLGRLLEGGTTADLATLIHSSAQIVKDKGVQLGQIFANAREVTGVLASRAPDLSTAISSLNDAIGTVADSSKTISAALSSTAGATGILAAQQADLDRLVRSLDSASSVLARYSKVSESPSDRSVKDLTGVLDKVMTTTSDLDKAVSALAQFTDLWPRAFPGDYLQLDVVFSPQNVKPPSASSAGSPSGAAPSGGTSPTPATNDVSSLANLLWGAVR